mgnify:CR=1 FL=1
MIARERFYSRPDTLSLGVCNGCQLMMELDLLGLNDGSHMDHNISHKFESTFLSIEIPDNHSVMFRSCHVHVLHVKSGQIQRVCHLTVAVYAFFADNGGNARIIAMVSPAENHAFNIITDKDGSSVAIDVKAALNSWYSDSAAKSISSRVVTVPPADTSWAADINSSPTSCCTLQERRRRCRVIPRCGSGF